MSDEITSLKAEIAALRRKIYGLEFDLEAARSSVTNAALEGPGYYLFSEDGEVNKFPSQREAWLFQLELKDEGMSSVLVNVISREQGVDQGEYFECPPRPSNDPQDVRNAE
jgi:hypothetical protein